MAKELPYFRFTSQEWQNGLISLESYAMKGLYIDVCAYYWVQDCTVTRKMLTKKFRNARKNLNELIELQIVKHDSTTDNVAILYLNEQYDILSKKRLKYAESGKKGGEQKASNARETLEQKPSYKDKDKDKENNKDKKKVLTIRKIEFSALVEKFEPKYSELMVNQFIAYWTEHNEKGKLMRFEMSKNQPFNIERRLVTWNTRNKSNGTFKSNTSGGSRGNSQVADEY